MVHDRAGFAARRAQQGQVVADEPQDEIQSAAAETLRIHDAVGWGLIRQLELFERDNDSGGSAPVRAVAAEADRDAAGVGGARACADRANLPFAPCWWTRNASAAHCHGVTGYLELGPPGRT